MLKYIAKRFVMSILIIWVVVSFSFFVIRLMPGNALGYLRAQLEKQGGMTPEEIEQRLASVYGITTGQPMWKQYVDYISDVLHGDFGTSIINPGASVGSIIGTALPWTIFSVAVALLISFVIGIAVGTVMAAFRDQPLRQVLTFFVSFLSAVPNYLVAILLIYFLADLHRIFPTGRRYSADVTPGWNFPFIGSVIMHAVLPVVAYVITAFGGWALAMKGSVVSTLGADYVRAAEAWGLRQAADHAVLHRPQLDAAAW